MVIILGMALPRVPAIVEINIAIMVLVALAMAVVIMVPLVAVIIIVSGIMLSMSRILELGTISTIITWVLLRVGLEWGLLMRAEGGWGRVVVIVGLGMLGIGVGAIIVIIGGLWNPSQTLVILTIPRRRLFVVLVLMWYRGVLRGGGGCSSILSCILSCILSWLAAGLGLCVVLVGM